MVVNLEKWKARIARVPQRAKEAAQASLEREADEMVSAMKRAAPASKDRDPGELRDSIRWEPSTKRELSVVIVADPTDDKGRGYGRHVEFGHRTQDGDHVAASPFFFPTYRARRKAMKRRMQAATKKAVKEEFGK